MASKKYELIEHTADIGIRIKGKDLPELFSNAALAMFDIIAEKRAQADSSKTKKFHIAQNAPNLEELFVNWLNELLSLSAVKGAIFTDFRFDSINEKALDAQVLGDSVENHKVNVEIKAATYHELEISRDRSGWVAKVIFDV